MTGKKHPLEKRLSKMRKHKHKIEHRLNDFYDLALPDRIRVGENGTNSTSSEDEQDDIFDSTLQQAVTDFSADQMDFFTPDYKPWVKMKVGRQFSDGNQASLKKQIKEYEETLYDLIRETNFYEQQEEIFKDLAGAAGGIAIPFAPITKPVMCIPILMANLLFDEGPYCDLDGRYNEYLTEARNLEIRYPGNEKLAKILMRKGSKNKDRMVKVIEGCHQNYKDDGGISWIWNVMVDGEMLIEKDLQPDEPPMTHVVRWRHNPPSPWAMGASDIALAPARTLDELALLNLKKLGKQADPPYSYENDGVFNPSNGVDAGDFYPRQRGSQPPSAMIEPGDSRDVFFDREKLEMLVKRALYQDGPLQRGDTPPTASQWLSEEARHMRRQSRRRVYREYVLPVLKRFAYVFALRGQLPQIKIDGETVSVEFISPLSKASDVDEVTSGMEFARNSIGMFGEAGVGAINVIETMENWQDRLGDTTVVINDEQQPLPGAQPNVPPTT